MEGVLLVDTHVVLRVRHARHLQSDTPIFILVLLVATFAWHASHRVVPDYFDLGEHSDHIEGGMALTWKSCLSLRGIISILLINCN